MDCSLCDKPIEIGEKFVSGFGPDKSYSIQHASCVKNPQKVKTMNEVRMWALDKFAENVKFTQPSVTGDQPKG